jgi:hypothetical protein
MEMLWMILTRLSGRSSRIEASVSSKRLGEGAIQIVEDLAD